VGTAADCSPGRWPPGFCEAARPAPCCVSHSDTLLTCIRDESIMSKRFAVRHGCGHAARSLLVELAP
jgi:hypothetical protein